MTAFPYLLRALRVLRVNKKMLVRAANAEVAEKRGRPLRGYNC
jgi:hypothetical protein